MTTLSFIPETMTAIGISEPGGPEVLKPETRPVPKPGPGQLLVKVAAAGVNRPDVVQRLGRYPAPEGASDIPGLEVAGTVVATGDATTTPVCTKVTALVAGGGYAEYCLVDEALALPIPSGLSLVEAAALPETAFTVWSNVFDRAGLKPGERFLVHGGTSGIGTMAIQLAKAFQAEVFTTVGSPEKVEAAKALGADHVINYRTDDFVAAIRLITAGHGVNVILDMVGGPYVERNWRAAAVEGRIVQIASLMGKADKLSFDLLMVKRLVHTGSTLRARELPFKAAIAKALKEKVWPLVEARRVRPVIDATMPLAEAASAHARMEASSHVGKIVLTL